MTETERTIIIDALRAGADYYVDAESVAYVLGSDSEREELNAKADAARALADRLEAGEELCETCRDARARELETERLIGETFDPQP